MSKKDKKIEIQVADAKVNVGKDSFEGYTLTIGKKVIGEIAELDGQFAIIKNGNVDSFYKKLEKAVEILIENYNFSLTHELNSKILPEKNKAGMLWMNEWMDR